MSSTITYNKQIIKFGLYGLFKNLKFFEPFLWLYFLMSGMSLFHIGLLYSVRETIIYIFEIPSGVFADRFGKKNELILCFLFYISSFIVFFFADAFIIFLLAMVLFGFGEALRSGTHKAMIMEYLDKHEIKDRKSKVYGLTRSYSNLGAMISSLGAIVLILFEVKIEYLFLIAIIPYTVDLLLITSYPKYLNNKLDTTFTMKSFMIENVRSIKYVFSGKGLNTLLIESAGYNALFKTIKDYIQPIMLAIGITTVLFTKVDLEGNIRIYIGAIYALSQLISVFVSRNAYRLEQKVKPNTLLPLIWNLTAVTILILGIFVTNIYVVLVAFILFYAFLNVRKPFMVEKIGNATINEKRASVLSIESQMSSIIIIIFAPILGFISDYYNIQTMLLFLGMLMLLIFAITKKRRVSN